ncbi:hypothetical protein [Candidatus Nitrosocosmicus sp. SS]|jgi:hypothetical protein|uniref:hypothetical protein n=1 Tax=Candidatus Nitrosocosmicus agrestis TaxID=2563600 RepID=UPI00122E1555|nr:hypothetical protein [Candidatus Nitrosocosmicus sp. SS]KAA2283586.1 hypothetical protein F1Z66_01550 [Candidatus Nitrosocosmicus sp. SS]KAF0869668.1 hypothetical protein E5N71_04080 [Candidatus Nitrosocosmicus sp. SS]
MLQSNTNKLTIKSITIEDILYRDVEKLESNNDEEKEYKEEISLYRDIIRFILSDYKDKYNPEIEKDDMNGIPIIVSFRIWPLCKWLFNNNKDLQDAYEEEYGSRRVAIEKRPTKIKGKVARRLERLVQLGLFDIDENKVKSQRNKGLETLLYHVPRSGILVALTLDLQNCDKGSDRYKKMLLLTLNEYLISIPPNYKNYDNYYYYFLKTLLTKCINKYDDILDYFFYYMSKHSFGFLINFHDLRYTMNNFIFEKILNDNNFRELFYETLNNFKTPLFSKEPQDKLDKKILDTELKNIEKSRHMIKVCFKSDIESQIDKDMWESLKYDTHMMKSFQYTNSQKKRFIPNHVYKNGLYEKIEREKVINHQIRNEWEIIKNNNLNSNKITMIVKCQRCSHIFSYLYNIESQTWDAVGLKP